MKDIIQKAHGQLRKLYLLNFLGNISIAGAAWVALLVSRGFSLVEVGFAETVFHIVSIIAEIPSGMFADVWGRKKSLMVSSVCSILGSFFMGFIDSYAGVLISIAFSALSYNFGSGTDSALAFDTLKEAKDEDFYDRYVSVQTIIYRVSSSLASLGAGIALLIGNRNAQLLGIAIGVISFIFATTLKENMVIERKKSISYTQRLKGVVVESATFLRTNGKAAGLIFANGLVGAFDVLLLFFLQSRFQDAGAGNILLGVLLFITYAGGILGAVLSEGIGKKTPFVRLFFICLTLVLLGCASSFTNVLWIMTLGGFFSAFGDDLLQIRADVKLNNMIPESSRATLISVNSLCFSLIMIVLSPLAGVMFSL
ncbi:MAG TPA: MFS transporter [Clostridiales bacterium]|nr:MFS transporter [Clostridiales bacterium]